MADLYFNAAVDGDWDNVLNWWTDTVFTLPAGAIPTNGDVAFIEASCSSNGGAGAVCSILNVNSLAIGSPTLSIPVSVSQSAHIYNAGTVSGDLTVGTTLLVDSGGSHNGASSCNSADISGANAGTITTVGTLTVYGGGSNSGYINGPVNLGGINTGTITGAVTIGNGGDNQGSIIGATTIDSGGINNNSITGAFLINSGGVNSGTITGNGTIDIGANGPAGAITGNVTLTGGGSNYGTVTGTLTAPAEDNGDGTWGYAGSALGEFTTLKLTGVTGAQILGGLL